MKLISLPDAKNLQKHFTIGKYYQICGEIGNGYVILNDADVMSIVLKTCFEQPIN